MDLSRSYYKHYLIEDLKILSMVILLLNIWLLFAVSCQEVVCSFGHLSENMLNIPIKTDCKIAII